MGLFFPFQYLLEKLQNKIFGIIDLGNAGDALMSISYMHLDNLLYLDKSLSSIESIRRAIDWLLSLI